MKHKIAKVSWFICESKKYMSYNQRNKIDKLKFWARFSSCFLIFYYYEILDWLHFRK